MLRSAAQKYINLISIIDRYVCDVQKLVFGYFHCSFYSFFFNPIVSDVFLDYRFPEHFQKLERQYNYEQNTFCTIIEFFAPLEAVEIRYIFRVC